MAKMSDSEIKKLAKQIAGTTRKTAAKFTQKIAANKKKADKQLDAKVKRIKDYRKEASRLVSMANKRVRRLEENDLKSSPAYRGYLESGGNYFSVKGKNHNELQAEVARMKRFIDANTSTVRGVNSYLKDMAKNTGIKYKNLTELRAKADKFFELASKTEQYLRTVEDMASAIGYEKIWEQINVYTETNKIDLSQGKHDIDTMVKNVTDALKEYDKPESLDFTSTGGDRGWYKLPKE